nr:MAG TPA: hypothetical protein [Caudoviricetes sp.]
MVSTPLSSRRVIVVDESMLIGYLSAPVERPGRGSVSNSECVRNVGSVLCPSR